MIQKLDRALLADLTGKVGALLDQGYLDSLLRTRLNAELVLDSLHEGIIAHDRHRRIFYFNKAAETITGFRRHELLGHDCHEVFPGTFCGGNCSFCGEGELDLPVDPYHLLFRTKDGAERRLEMSITPMGHGDGSVQGVVASFRDLTRELELAERLVDQDRYAGIIGRSPAIRQVFQSIRELADSNVPVLISGESGTGKELVAAAIHHEGRRVAKLFVPVNCGALPENLLESELFGHVRGAFTGAIRDKKGRFELADGGSIFLDEIGDITQAMQVKLLRVLQNGTFQRVGGEETVTVDVRVISATHKDLMAEIAAGRFREDLFYRLCVVPLDLPPLRERKSDLSLLISHFIKQIAADEGRDEVVLSPEALEVLMTWDWPGNVRELQNIIRYIMVRCREEIVRPHHLPENLLVGAGKRMSVVGGAARKRRQKLSVDQVRRALLETGGNRLQAARLLEVGRATLYRFLDNHPEIN
ncbi:MAG: sigma 54-interacting transcriptional regulator [Proteobacteria bacterium]|nr:sigma 54-interacting transcriptional regulator [Pseudomonadota bacterium]MBU1687603.1 sigma 54-interacting transcriptional regulator [Pseudomonadota bacterium]